MTNPTERQEKALKQESGGEIHSFLSLALTEEDARNRRRAGEQAAEGRGRAQILEEILELIDAATVPPIN